MFTENLKAVNQLNNTACSERVSLDKMIEQLSEITGNSIKVNYGPERIGDVIHSLASIEKARILLGYSPLVFFNEGLEKIVDWYRENL